MFRKRLACNLSLDWYFVCRQHSTASIQNGLLDGCLPFYFMCKNRIQMDSLVSLCIVRIEHGIHKYCMHILYNMNHQLIQRTLVAWWKETTLLKAIDSSHFCIYVLYIKLIKHYYSDYVYFIVGLALRYMYYGHGMVFSNKKTVFSAIATCAVHGIRVYSLSECLSAPFHEIASISSPFSFSHLLLRCVRVSHMY